MGPTRRRPNTNAPPGSMKESASHSASAAQRPHASSIRREARSSSFRDRSNALRLTGASPSYAPSVALPTRVTRPRPALALRSVSCRVHQAQLPQHTAVEAKLERGAPHHSAGKKLLLLSPGGFTMGQSGSWTDLGPPTSSNLGSEGECRSNSAEAPGPPRQGRSRASTVRCWSAARR